MADMFQELCESVLPAAFWKRSKGQPVPMQGPFFQLPWNSPCYRPVSMNLVSPKSHRNAQSKSNHLCQFRHIKIEIFVEQTSAIDLTMIICHSMILFVECVCSVLFVNSRYFLCFYFIFANSFCSCSPVRCHSDVERSNCLLKLMIHFVLGRRNRLNLSAVVARIVVHIVIITSRQRNVRWKWIIIEMDKCCDDDCCATIETTTTIQRQCWRCDLWFVTSKQHRNGPFA